MEKYSEYKDSGVQWLGKIPGHWNVRRIKWLFKEEDDKNDNLGYQLLTFSRSKGIIPFSDVNDKAPSASDLSKYKVIRPGQLLENRMQAWSGMFGCSHIEGCVSPDYSVFSPSKGVSTEFYAHLFRTKLYIQQFANASKGIGDGFNRLYTPQFHKIVAVYPPLSEQQAIVAFLDDKCGKIDRLLENKRKELDLLQEMKQRIIADAVTRGLDPSVKMKPSGIPWLPQIPEHWDCTKLKAFCKDNKVKNIGNIESKVLSLSYGNVIVKQNINFGLVPESYETYQIVNPGNIILRLTDLQNDHRSLRTGLVKDRGIITSAYIGLIVNDMNSEYAQLLLHSYDVMKIFYGMGGGLRQSMSYQDIANLYIPIPPITEQRAIVSHINSRVEKIDALASKLQQEIDNIKEYKQRLISDVVTGQIKVC